MNPTPRTRADIERVSLSNDLYEAAEDLTLESARWKILHARRPLAAILPAEQARIDILDRARRICSELARQVLILGRTDVAEAYADAARILVSASIDARADLDQAAA